MFTQNLFFVLCTSLSFSIRFEWYSIVTCLIGQERTKFADVSLLVGHLIHKALWAASTAGATIHYLKLLSSSFVFKCRTIKGSRSQWPRGLRHRSAAARLLRSWARIPPGACMFVCQCCVLSGRGLCDELITRTEESYRLWRVVECDLETSWMRRPWPAGRGCCAKRKKEKKKNK